MSRSLIILVIEESPNQQAVIGYHLGKNIPQAALVFSTTPEETLLYLSHCGEGRLTPPCLVLLSMQMTHRDRDWQLLNELRVRYPQLPVVVLSADDESESIRHTYELGARSFIAKPCDLDAWDRLCKQLRDYWLGIVTLPLPY